MNKKVEKYLEENIDVAKDVARELNGYNGALEWLDVQYNDEDFFSSYFAHDILQAVRAAQYGSYDYNEEYVRFDGYGNLESLSEQDYTEEIKSSIGDIADELVNNWHNIYINDDLVDILDVDEDEE